MSIVERIYQTNKDEAVKRIFDCSENELISIDKDMFLQSMATMYSLENIVLQEKKKTDLHSSPIYDSLSPEKLIEGYQIEYDICFTGDTELLRSIFPDVGRQYGTIVVRTQIEGGVLRCIIQLPKNMLNSSEKDPNDIVDEVFHRYFDEYYIELNKLNEYIEKLNLNLSAYIKKALDKRVNDVKDLAEIREKLNIPLRINPKAPNTTPVKLEIVPQAPALKADRNLDYEISEHDYANIKRIINLICITMERTARTFSRFEEEELRDVILATLNSHYVMMATGETFSKIGKTDIHILFDNKSAYIGECKIWYGIKKFIEAVIQLVGYTTWRDSKTSLIVFNKNNKDFSKIIKEIDGFIHSYESFVECDRIQQYEWQCRLYKSCNTTEIISINIVAFDLHIEVDSQE